MTPTKAAEVIGCSPQHVRTLIRAGKLKATRRKYPGGYYYDVTSREAKRYRNLPLTRGWPRGKPHKSRKP